MTAMACEPSRRRTDRPQCENTMFVHMHRTPTAVLPADDRRTAALWHLRLLVLAAPQTRRPAALCDSFAEHAFSLYRASNMLHEGGCLGWVLEALSQWWAVRHN